MSSRQPMLSSSDGAEARPPIVEEAEFRGIWASGLTISEIGEFYGRIKAGKDSEINEDFVLVARVEALVSGYGLSEALRRAEADHAAGADAILIQRWFK